MKHCARAIIETSSKCLSFFIVPWLYEMMVILFYF